MRQRYIGTTRPASPFFCPGKVTAYLADPGLTAFGIDLSPKMVELARRRHPHLNFAAGPMTALPLRDGRPSSVARSRPAVC
ncbi:methyltransferase domain-containing protein [Streptomyces sp. NPDC086554]|uniref:class I SAM-dependent methyltransferase n=1 Tax=Streptomyces sp. NPDC086554 TaxID=3154864 RepID=UPI00343B16B3